MAVDGQGVEISPRFKLPVLGAAYDFGSKFGATPDLAADLLRQVARRGYVASLTFHPGTQCTDPIAWESYIRVARDICDLAGDGLDYVGVDANLAAAEHLTPQLQHDSIETCAVGVEVSHRKRSFARISQLQNVRNRS